MEELIFGLIGGFIAWLIKDETEKNKTQATENHAPHSHQNLGGGIIPTLVKIIKH